MTIEIWLSKIRLKKSIILIVLSSVFLLFILVVFTSRAVKSQRGVHEPVQSLQSTFISSLKQVRTQKPRPLSNSDQPISEQNIPADCSDSNTFHQQNDVNQTLSEGIILQEIVKPFGVADCTEIIFIKGGSFRMGSEIDSDDDEKPVHTIQVSSFWLGKYEVTVAQFKIFISETGYQSDAEKGDGSYIWTGRNQEKRSGVNWRCDARGNVRKFSEMNNPVIHVSWNDAVAYCDWLSRKTGQIYRLPTEAEWEYAARSGGKMHTYSWGNNLPGGRIGGNIADESLKRALGWSSICDGYDDGYVYTAPVGSYQPNELGLFDLTGNVWEWCLDWYDSGYYKRSTQDDPLGPPSGTLRVLRGGSWYDEPTFVRCCCRGGDSPDSRSGGVGFRIVRAER